MVDGEGNVGLSVPVSVDNIFGSEANEVSTFAKSASTLTAGANSQIPECPKCGSRTEKVWRHGFRSQMFGLHIQRWTCCRCGLRFSDPEDVKKAMKASLKTQEFESQSLKSGVDLVSNCQICVKETKNLVAEQRNVVIPRNKVDLKGAIVDFLWQLKKENKANVTIENYDYALHALVSQGINLLNPEDFIEKMALQKQWTNTRKYNLTKAYRSFLNHKNIEAKLPKYKPTRTIPYIPPQEYLDQLIANCNDPMAALVKTLKETAARPVEALRMQVDDLDVGNKKLSINNPAKGSNARIRPISDQLLNMLLSLPRKDKRLFPYKSTQSAGRSFRKMRKRAIRKLGNPELRKIDFYTCRYWRATYEYHKTHDFGAVMQLLGHTSLRYVLLYAQLSEAYFGDVGYVCKEAFTRQESMRLVELGFEYVLTDKEGVSLFRKAN